VNDDPGSGWRTIWRVLGTSGTCCFGWRCCSGSGLSCWNDSVAP